MRRFINGIKFFVSVFYYHQRLKVVKDLKSEDSLVIKNIIHRITRHKIKYDKEEWLIVYTTICKAGNSYLVLDYKVTKLTL